MLITTDSVQAAWQRLEAAYPPTYAGRLAMFVGLYIDTFGMPPAPTIEVDGDSVTYSELSERLWRQMTASPSCGVSCYHQQSMVPCPVPEQENEGELASCEWASAWTQCTAAELAEPALFRELDAYLAPLAVTGFRVDPYLSGLYVLAHEIQAGDFRRMVQYRHVRR